MNTEAAGMLDGLHEDPNGQFIRINVPPHHQFTLIEYERFYCLELMCYETGEVLAHCDLMRETRPNA